MMNDSKKANRIIALILVVVMSFSIFASCTPNTNGDNAGNNEQSEQENNNGNNDIGGGGTNNEPGNTDEDVDTDIEDDFNDGYCDYIITDLFVDVQNNIVSATVNTPVSCKLLVRFADEESYFVGGKSNKLEYIADGDIYARTDIAGNLEESITVTLPIQGGKLPEYFVVEASLLNSEEVLLGTSYYSITNTRRFDEFNAKTIVDFEGNDRLLNFDGSQDNNFGVLADDVKMLVAKSITKADKMDVGTEGYRVLGLSGDVFVGDKIYVVSEDGTESLLTTVEGLENDGDYILIISKNSSNNNAVQLKDFYKFLKVNTVYDGEYTANNAEQSISACSAAEVCATGSITTLNDLEYESELLTLTGTLTGTINATCHFVWDPVLFGYDYFYCDMTFRTIQRLEVEATGKLNGSSGKNWFILEGENGERYIGNIVEFDGKNQKLGTVYIPFGITGLSAKADIGVRFGASVVGVVKAACSMEAVIGFSYDTKDGYKTTKKDYKYEEPKIVKCEGEMNLSIGPDFGIGLAFLKDLVSANFRVSSSVNVRAYADFPQMEDRRWDTFAPEAYDPERSKYVKHNCQYYIYVKVGIDIEANIIFDSVLLGEDAFLFSKELFRLDIDIGAFDACNKHPTLDSILRCDNIVFAVWITNVDYDVEYKDYYGNRHTALLEKIVVENNDSGNMIVVEVGQVFYLTEGSYTAYAVYDNGAWIPNEFTVDGVWFCENCQSYEYSSRYLNVSDENSHLLVNGYNTMR